MAVIFSACLALVALEHLILISLLSILVTVRAVKDFTNWVSGVDYRSINGKRLLLRGMLGCVGLGIVQLELVKMHPMDCYFFVVFFVQLIGDCM